MNSQTLLTIVLTAGACFFLYTIVKDFIVKKKVDAPTPTPSHNGSDDKNKVILPLQLAAYERLVLFVERITPQSLIGRVYTPGLTVVDMQIGLVQTIKAEFDHNIAQQIYVTPGAWEAVKTVKEQMISIIYHIANKMPSDAPAVEFNKQLIEVFMNSTEASPSDIAANILSVEAKKLMHA
ncbi:hypothetical protein LX64_03283 [Chitinophaga skermanii]|uniref:Uncharacterized protein n=1 Tax=Chitinophaga skermanii TaxID=331697 RepID=A0A327QES0_9BACT|nr:hypothetical protein [Chitinophaga skermanii]RAJ02274.1 hypothetical protein LX64_03283 [Chitinophaga skermanii]